jgi:hypoxia up-regulated 1
LRTAKSRLKWYTRRDENKIKTDEAKNNFESMIYTMRDWLREDENAPYVEESVSAAHIEQCTEWEDWLYDEGSNLMYNVYEDMFKNMTKDLNSYKARKSLFETRPEFIEKTNQALDKMKEVMEEDFESAATQEEKTDVIDKISEVKTWFNDLADQQSTLKKHEDPILNLDEVAKKVKNVKKLFDKVKNKKKPKVKKPKKEEKKEGEEEAEDADKKEEDASKEDDV